MPTKHNVGATLNVDGEHVLVTLGNRGSHTTVSIPLDIEQADELDRQLHYTMQEVHSEEEYESYLERTGLSHDDQLESLVQIDQGSLA